MSAWFTRPKRKVPEPQAGVSHQSDNPLFEERQASPEVQQFRSRVLTATGIVLGAFGLGMAVYGPWFAVERISVEGTRVITPGSVQAAVEYYLTTNRFGILPNRNLLVLSSGDAEHWLQGRIQRRISVERVTFSKQFRHGLTIRIEERTPAFTWQAGDRRGTLDTNGVIIETLTADAPATLPVVLDESEEIFGVDSSVVKREVVEKTLELKRYLEQASIAIDRFIIPQPQCPYTKPAEIEPELETNVNGAANANAPTKNSNINVATTNTNARVNRNSSSLDVDTLENQNSAIEGPGCDLVAAKEASQEIHIQVTGGPRVLFDRHQNLGAAVGTLRRLLGDRSNSGAQYIDIRFQERVFIR